MLKLSLDEIVKATKGKLLLNNNKEVEFISTSSKDIKENQTFNVDLISGATVTSRGFINSVKGGLSQSIEN